MTRLFLAIDLPKKERESLANQIEPLKKLYPQFSWVSTENYHITVYFFGEIQSEEKIINKLKDILFDQKKLYFYSTNLSLFINKKITIYLNFRREKNLEQMAGIVKDNFQMENSGNDKNITHLTLARAKIPSKQQYFALKRRLGRIFVDLEFASSRVALYESILTGKRPLYKKIAQFALG